MQSRARSRALLSEKRRRIAIHFMFNLFTTSTPNADISTNLDIFISSWMDVNWLNWMDATWFDDEAFNRAFRVASPDLKQFMLLDLANRTGYTLIYAICVGIIINYRGCKYTWKVSALIRKIPLLSINHGTHWHKEIWFCFKSYVTTVLNQSVKMIGSLLIVGLVDSFASEPFKRLIHIAPISVSWNCGTSSFPIFLAGHSGRRVHRRVQIEIITGKVIPIKVCSAAFSFLSLFKCLLRTYISFLFRWLSLLILECCLHYRVPIYPLLHILRSCEDDGPFSREKWIVAVEVWRRRERNRAELTGTTPLHGHQPSSSTIPMKK